MNKAETIKEKLFNLVNNGEIKNIMEAILFSISYPCKVDNSCGNGYSGTLIFTFEDDSILKIDSENYCYIEDENEISQLRFG